MPDQLIDELGLDISLASRATASYTPVAARREARRPARRAARGRGDPAVVRGADRRRRGVRRVARVLRRRRRPGARRGARRCCPRCRPSAAIREQVDPGIWRDFVDTPLGATIEARFADDTVRGVVATDALIGTFASMHDPSLVQNRCFLYHLIGNGTGEWRVPVGGMGAVTDALARAATEAGAEIVTVGRRQRDPRSRRRRRGDLARRQRHAHRRAPGSCWPTSRPGCCGSCSASRPTRTTKPEGAQLKINFLLDRLPRLRSGVDPAVAFAGTLHVAEDYSQLEAAYADAAAGRGAVGAAGRGLLPLADRPLDPRRSSPEGMHTLTYFGVHTPGVAVRRATRRPRRSWRSQRALAAINEHLVEPIEACVARDGDGQPCIEAKIPQDIEARPGHARRPHLPRRPGLAVGPEPRSSGDPRPAVGRADRRRVGAPVRLRRPARWRRLGHRRPQRRPGGPRLAAELVPDFSASLNRW